MIKWNKRYQRIGEKLIDKESCFLDIKMANVRIAYLESDVEKIQNRKIVYADCRKVAEQYKWCCDYDFMITVYQPNVIGFTSKQIRILLEHELLHIGVDYDSEEPSFYVAPHDLEEFYRIINRYGTDWQAKG